MESAASDSRTSSATTTRVRARQTPHPKFCSTGARHCDELLLSGRTLTTLEGSIADEAFDTHEIPLFESHVRTARERPLSSPEVPDPLQYQIVQPARLVEAKQLLRDLVVLPLWSIPLVFVPVLLIVATERSRSMTHRRSETLFNTASERESSAALPHTLFLSLSLLLLHISVLLVFIFHSAGYSGNTLIDRVPKSTFVFLS